MNQEGIVVARRTVKREGSRGTVGGIALAAGSPAGGLLIAAVGWHGTFQVNVPVGIAGI